MVGHREGVERPERFQVQPRRSAASGRGPGWPGRRRRRRCARRHSPARAADQGVDDRPGRACPRRVQHRQRRARQPEAGPALRPRRRGAPGPTASPAGCARASRAAAHYPRRRRTRPSGPSAVASAPANSPAPQYRSRATSPGCGSGPGPDGGGQGVGGGGVDLPEAAPGRSASRAPRRAAARRPRAGHGLPRSAAAHQPDVCPRRSPGPGRAGGR